MRRYYPSLISAPRVTTEVVTVDKWDSPTLKFMPTRTKSNSIYSPYLFSDTKPTVPFIQPLHEIPRKQVVSQVVYGNPIFGDTKPIVPFIPYQDMTFKFAQRNMVLYLSSTEAIKLSATVRNLPLLGVG